MALKTLEQKLKYRISLSKDAVFLIKDFFDLSDSSQLKNALILDVELSPTALQN